MFDIEIDSQDIDEIVRTVQLIAPTFGGINLEDIRAPECFEIESRLIELLDIPVFHDDQHGTAIISGAALINALLITRRDISETRVVFCGGRRGIGCAPLSRHRVLSEKCAVRTAAAARGRPAASAGKASFLRATPDRTLADRCTAPTASSVSAAGR